MNDMTIMRRRYKLECCAQMAEYLDQDYLLELLAEAGVKERKDLEEFDPPLSPAAVEWLSSRLACIPQKGVGVPRRLQRKHLESGAVQFARAGRTDQLNGMAPLVSEACMERIVETLIARGFDPDVEDLSDIYIFMPDSAMKKLEDYMTEHDFPSALATLKCYL